MKILKYAQFNESLEEEMFYLKNHNYVLKDQLTTGDYNLYVFYNTEYENYILALTSAELSFTKPEDQIKKPNFSYKKDSLSLITDKLKYRLKKYKVLTVGTFNEKRAKKYHILLKRLKFNVSDLDFIEPNQYLFDIES